MCIKKGLNLYHATCIICATRRQKKIKKLKLKCYFIRTKYECRNFKLIKSPSPFPSFPIMPPPPFWFKKKLITYKHPPIPSEYLADFEIFFSGRT